MLFQLPCNIYDSSGLSLKDEDYCFATDKLHLMRHRMHVNTSGRNGLGKDFIFSESDLVQCLRVCVPAKSRAHSLISYGDLILGTNLDQEDLTTLRLARCVVFI